MQAEGALQFYRDGVRRVAQGDPDETRGALQIDRYVGYRDVREFSAVFIRGAADEHGAYDVVAATPGRLGGSAAALPLPAGVPGADSGKIVKTTRRPRLPSPGVPSNNSSALPCSFATACTRLKPRPTPGVPRLASPR